MKKVLLLKSKIYIWISRKILHNSHFPFTLYTSFKKIKIKITNTFGNKQSRHQSKTKWYKKGNSAELKDWWYQGRKKWRCHQTFWELNKALANQHYHYSLGLQWPHLKILTDSFTGIDLAPMSVCYILMIRRFRFQIKMILNT